MNEEAFDKEEIRHHVQLCDTATHKVFYDKLEFIYVEIAKFDKTLEELETLYDKWLYALKNLYKLTQRARKSCAIRFSTVSLRKQRSPSLPRRK